MFLSNLRITQLSNVPLALMVTELCEYRWRASGGITSCHTASKELKPSPDRCVASKARSPETTRAGAPQEAGRNQILLSSLLSSHTGRKAQPDLHPSEESRVRRPAHSQPDGLGRHWHIPAHWALTPLARTPWRRHGSEQNPFQGTDSVRGMKIQASTWTCTWLHSPRLQPLLHTVPLVHRLAKQQNYCFP